MLQYEYLIGMFIFGAFWLVLYLVRKDLRKAMVWSGVYYIAIMTIAFLLYQLIPHEPARTLTPGYWAPKTLFNLGRIDGGLAIEDVLYQFFAAGIAAALYETLFREKIGTRSSKKLKRGHAIAFGLACGLLIHFMFHINDIYILIAFNFFGALAVIWQRKDLWLHSLMGGALFVIIYWALFSLFIALFPDFVQASYKLNLTTGVFVFGIPLEEYLYGFTFGMLWAPLYEYTFALRDKKTGSKKGKTKSLSFASAKGK